MTDRTFDLQARLEWRSHWPVVLASLAGFTLSGIHFYTIGLFMAPLEQEFSWNRSEISAGMMIVSTVAVLLSPFVGAMIDRSGARRFGIAGAVIYCLAIAALSLAGPSIWTWWMIWLLIALGSLCLKPTVWTAAVASKFNRSRGLALSVMLCGGGLGSAIFPYLTSILMQHLGWRDTCLVLGGAGALVVLPLLFLFFFDAKDDVRRRSPSSASKPTLILSGAGAREGLLSRRFIQLALSGFLTLFCSTGLVVHYVPMLTSFGLARDTAAAAAAGIGIAAMIGRLGSGFLLDRMNGVRIGTFMFSLPIISIAMLLGFHGSAWYAVAIAIVTGLCLGAEMEILAYLTARYFGLRNFGLIFGTIAGLLSLATGTGSLAAGIVYDLYGSYVPLLWGLLPLAGTSAILLSTLGPYPTLENRAEANHGSADPDL